MKYNILTMTDERREESGMLKVATKRGGEEFAADELATESTIEHGMGALEFMVFCETNPLPILCECRGGCEGVAGHNARVRDEHPVAYGRFCRTGGAR